MNKYAQDYKILYKRKVEELKVLEKALELACEDRCVRCYSKITGNCWYNPETYDCKSPKMFIQQAKEELEDEV